MDRGGWWAMAHRVTQSQTRLKRLSIQAHVGSVRWLFAYLISDLFPALHSLSDPPNYLPGCLTN